MIRRLIQLHLRPVLARERVHARVLVRARILVRVRARVRVLVSMHISRTRGKARTLRSSSSNPHEITDIIINIQSLKFTPTLHMHHWHIFCKIENLWQRARDLT